MKVTHDYLRKLIKESLEEITTRDLERASKKLFPKNPEASGGKVFLVFFRDYADTSVCGVYDNEAKAKQVADQMAKKSGMPWQVIPLSLNSSPKKQMLF